MLQRLTFETAIGVCALAFSEQGLAGVVLPSQTPTATLRALQKSLTGRGFDAAVDAEAESIPGWVRAAVAAMSQLLSGAGEDLDDIPLDRRNLSDFAARVYAEARKIPAGTTATYGELARAVGAPKAARAIGRAMATNPWPIVVPCHRVLGSQGELHGFSAPGGVRTKALMLAIERGEPPPDHSPNPRAPGRKRARSAQASLPFTR